MQPPFRDRQLQKHYDQSFSEASDASEDLRQVRALIATHDVFQMFEGPHSARVHGIRSLALSGNAPRIAPMVSALRC